MAMIEQAHHCSSGLTKTFFDLAGEYRADVWGGGLMPHRTGADFEGTLRSRAAENGTLEQNRERNR